MPAVNIHPFNSTQDLIQAVREKRWKTGLNPSTCLWGVCKERRLVLTASEKHEILSEIAQLAVVARRAKVHSKTKQRLMEEKGTMLPLTFATTIQKTDKTNQGSTFATLPTKTPKPQIIQEELFPGMVRSYQDRPHRWPRRQR